MNVKKIKELDVQFKKYMRCWEDIQFNDDIVKKGGTIVRFQRFTWAKFDQGGIKTGGASGSTYSKLFCGHCGAEEDPSVDDEENDNETKEDNETQDVVIPVSNGDKNLKNWLIGIKMDRYYDMFVAKGIEYELITSLQDSDLQDFGITKQYHRNIILRNKPN